MNATVRRLSKRKLIYLGLINEKLSNCHLSTKCKMIKVPQKMAYSSTREWPPQCSIENPEKPTVIVTLFCREKTPLV